MSNILISDDDKIVIVNNKAILKDPFTVQSGRVYTVSGSGNYTISPAVGFDSMDQVALTVPAGQISVPSSLSATSATVSTGTNTLTLTKSSVTNTPTVSTAGYISSIASSSSSISLTASVTTKGATTYTPGTTNQTIASGTYLTGTQTIQGDANLVGSNIISGKSIFGVPGAVTFSHYYEGSSVPSSSLGVNGDIYLQH